jgi:hypothetical protein
MKINGMNSLQSKITKQNDRREERTMEHDLESNGMNFNKEHLKNNYPSLYEKYQLDRYYQDDNWINMNDLGEKIGGDSALEIMTNTVPFDLLKGGRKQLGKEMMLHFMLIEADRYDISGDKEFVFEGDTGYKYTFNLLDMLKGISKMDTDDYLVELYKMFLVTPFNQQSLDYLFRDYAGKVIFTGYILGEENIKKHIEVKEEKN